MKRMLSIMLILLTIPALAAADEFRPIVIPPGANILEGLRNDTQHFSKLISLVEESGMKELTARGQRFTLLAPTNEAFDKLPSGVYESLLKDPARRRKFLQGHLLPGKVVFKVLFEPASSAAEGDPVTKVLKTVDGERIFLDCNGRHSGDHHPLINQKARVIASDFEGTNVVIQVIDSAVPLLPYIEPSSKH